MNQTMNEQISRLPYSEEGVCSVPDKEIISLLTKRIRDRLSLYFQDSLNWEDVEIKGAILRGQDLSRLIRFDLKHNHVSWRSSIFVKMCPEWESINPAKTEYETLQLLSVTLPQIMPDFGVPRPLDFFPELNAYVMESVGTNSLKPLLLKRNSRFMDTASTGELLTAISKSATWLSLFHEATKSSETIRFEYDPFAPGVDEYFDYRAMSSFGFHNKTIDKLDQLFEQIKKFNGAFELPCAKCHWDYTPAHVFFQDNTTNVIDILGADKIPIYEDIGHFLAAMATVNNLPFHLAYDYRRADKELAELFIKTYRSQFLGNNQEFILLANIYKLKYLIAWFGAQHQRVTSRLGKWCGKVFTTIRLAKIFEPSVIYTMSEIENKIGML